VQGREIKVIFRADCSGSTEHLICTPPLAWHRAAAAVQNGGTARGLSREVDYALRSTAGLVARGVSPSRAIAAMCLATNWGCRLAGPGSQQNWWSAVLQRGYQMLEPAHRRPVGAIRVSTPGIMSGIL
jgi:hypothetical protein